MARTTLDAWLPEEKESSVIQLIGRTSAIEAVARKLPMGSDTKSVNRSSAVHVEVVPKGGAYGEDGGDNDDIVLKARKFGKVIRLAEEDIDDSVSDVIAVKKTDWGTSYSATLDNACLGVNAVENGTTVPFTSLYKALTTDDSTTGYTANDNVHTAATAGTFVYDELADAISIYEASPYFDQAKGVILADPSIKGIVRKVKNSNGDPIFVDAPRADDPDRLFGYQVKWTKGAKVSTVATDNPTGLPFLAIGNSDFLLLGVRSGPESIVIDGRSGASALTDETLLKIRARRGFVLGDPRAFGILIDKAAV